MRQYKRISEKPYKQICDSEWKRARKVLAPLLDNVSKPVFLWSSGMRRYYGFCYGCRSNQLRRIGNKWYKTSVIAITTKYKDPEYICEEDEFRKTISHEIAHLVPTSKHHDAIFMRSIQALGTTRYAKSIKRTTPASPSGG